MLVDPESVADSLVKILKRHSRVMVLHFSNFAKADTEITSLKDQNICLTLSPSSNFSL